MVLTARSSSKWVADRFEPTALHPPVESHKSNENVSRALIGYAGRFDIRPQLGQAKVVMDTGACAKSMPAGGV
jgi:hypothetical protein